MAKDEKHHAEKLREQCSVIASLVIAIRPLYRTARTRQRALLETIVGAGIWYVPKPRPAWTGFISLGALRSFHPTSGVAQPRLSEEHVYPRKVAARLLLEDESLTASSLVSLFQEKYGRVHLITPEENKAVQPFQRAGVFTNSENAYLSAGITLLKISGNDLRLIKRRDAKTIEYLSGSGNASAAKPVSTVAKTSTIRRNISSAPPAGGPEGAIYKLTSRPHKRSPTLWAFGSIFRKLKESEGLHAICNQRSGEELFSLFIPGKFLREKVVPKVAVDKRGRVTFEIHRDCSITWRDGYKIDGTEFLRNDHRENA